MRLESKTSRILSFFIFLLTGCLSKWLLCSAVAVGEAALMMMTGSLKQAKHIALPRGLISCTNLPLIRLRPLSVYLFLSLCSFLPLSYDLRLFRSLFCSGWDILSFSFSNGWALDWPLKTSGSLLLHVCLRNRQLPLFASLFSSVYADTRSTCAHTLALMSEFTFKPWTISCIL